MATERVIGRFDKTERWTRAPDGEETDRELEITGMTEQEARKLLHEGEVLTSKLFDRGDLWHPYPSRYSLSNFHQWIAVKEESTESE